MVKDFIKYIGRIEGTAIDEKCINHSLFGNLNNNNEVEKIEMKDIKKYVSSFVEKGCNLTNAVVSLKEEDAIRNGFTTREAWKNMINLKIKDIAKEYGILPSEVEWVGSIHSEEGHIHCHLMFFDKKELENGKVSKRVNYSNIKKELNKVVYKIDLDKQYDIRNVEKKEIGENAKEFLNKGIKNIVQEYTPDLINQTYFNNKISIKNLINIKKKIQAIYDLQKELAKEREKKVVFKYQFEEQEVKNELINVSKNILSVSASCKKSFDNYVKSSIEVEKTLGNINKKNTIEKVEQKAKNEMYKKISNKVLDFIKEEKNEEYKLKQMEWIKKQKEFEDKKEEWLEKEQEYKEIQKRNAISNLISGIFNILDNSYKSQSAKGLRIKQELSKQAKKEKILMKKFSSSIDWER